MKLKLFLILVLIVLFSSISYSYTPNSDGNFRDTYGIYNATTFDANNVTGTYIYENGSRVLTSSSSVNYSSFSNSSTYWDNNGTPLFNTLDITEVGLLASLSVTGAVSLTEGLNWTYLTNYPTACATGLVVKGVGDGLTCISSINSSSFANYSTYSNSSTYWDDETSQSDLNVNSSTWWSDVSSYVSKWFYSNSDVFTLNETQLNESINVIVNSTVSGYLLKTGDNATGDYDFTNGTILINQDTNNIALSIDSESNNSDVFKLVSQNINGGIPFYVRQEAITTTSDIARIWNVAGGTANVLYVYNNGTGDGILLEQNGDGVALDIDSESDSLNSVFIKGKYPMQVQQDISGGYAARFRQLSTVAGGSYVVSISQENTTDDTNNLEIENDGTGKGMFIDQNGNQVGFWVDSAATSEPAMYWISANAGDGRFGDPDTTFATSYVNRNLNSSFTVGPVFGVRQDNVLDDQAASRVQQDGTGDGIFVDVNNNGIALNIDSEASTADLVTIDSIAAYDGNGLWVGSGSTVYTSLGRGRNNSNGTNVFYRDISSANTAGPVVLIEQNNAADDQAVLTLQQDGTGSHITTSTLNETLIINPNGSGQTRIIGVLNVSGTIYGTRFISDIATGTAPFGVSSTTVVNNLNSNMVEGTDLGTLTDAKWCVYDLAGTEIDCNVEPVSDTTYSAGNGISLSTTTFSVAGNTALTQDVDGLSVTADGITDTQLEYNTGQHLTTTSDPTFRNVTLTKTCWNVGCTSYTYHNGTALITVG